MPLPVVEEVKKPELVDFVPDVNFSWNLDLESLPSKGKKKKTTPKIDPMDMPIVIK